MCVSASAFVPLISESALISPRIFQGLTLQGFTRNGLQSRSATACLLINSDKCMKDEIKLVFPICSTYNRESAYFSILGLIKSDSGPGSL